MPWVGFEPTIPVFFNSHSGGWSPSWVYSARRTLNGLLYLPRVNMMMENLVEWRLAGEPKYSEKTCPSATLSTKNPTWPDPDSNPGCGGWKPATNRLSYGAATIPVSERAKTVHALDCSATVTVKGFISPADFYQYLSPVITSSQTK
jgi:hypothetical protein